MVADLGFRRMSDPAGRKVLNPRIRDWWPTNRRDTRSITCRPHALRVSPPPSRHDRHATPHGGRGGAGATQTLNPSRVRYAGPPTRLGRQVAPGRRLHARHRARLVASLPAHLLGVDTEPARLDHMCTEIRQAASRRGWKGTFWV